MEKEPRTTESILNRLKLAVQQREVHSPSWWVDRAQELTVLMGEETDLLAEMEMIVAQKKVDFMEDSSVAAAEAKVEATPEYRDMRKQRGRVKMIEEYIRISKKQATLKDNEMSYAS